MEYSLDTPQYSRRLVSVILPNIKIQVCSSPLYETMQCLVYNRHLSTLYLKWFLDCSSNQTEQGTCSCSFVLSLHVYTTHLCIMYTCEYANTHSCRGQDRLARACLNHSHLIPPRQSLCWTPSSPRWLDWLASKLSEPICLFPHCCGYSMCSHAQLSSGPRGFKHRTSCSQSKHSTHWVISVGPINKFYRTFFEKWW